MKFSSGIDAYRFVMTKSIFLKFMRQIELNEKLRLISRNKSIKAYIDDKFKNERNLFTKIRYINFKRGNKTLTNTMLVFENTNSLNELCRKRKKPYGYYIKVVFAGLYQPSRTIYKETYRILSKFSRRFKAHEIDYAHDIKMDVKPGASSKEWFKRRVSRYSSKIISYNTTLYANECHERFYGLKKICFYDKYEKQTSYHKQKLDEELKGWRRVELTFRLDEKFLDRVEHQSLYEYVEVMDEIINKLTDGAYPFGVDITALGEQVAFFKDNRRALSFTKSA